MADKQLHDAGYRYCWPPTIDRLTPHQQAKISVWNQAEAYLQQERRRQYDTPTSDSGTGKSLSRTYY